MNTLFNNIARNTNARNSNSIVNNANNGIANNTNSIAQFAKENNTMKAFTQFACRAAATIALTGILALAHSAAKADVIVDDWIQPSHATGVAAGTTELQLKLYNSDNYSVSGLKVKVTFERTEKFLGITIVLGSTTVQTSAISMTAYQDKWIAVNIPTKTSNNLALLNEDIVAVVEVGSNSGGAYSFLDAAPSAENQIEQINPPANLEAGTTFAVKVTNNGYAASKAETLTAELYAYAEGQVSPSYPVTGTVPALQPGQSAWVYLKLPKITTYDDTGFSSINGTVSLGSQTINVEF